MVPDQPDGPLLGFRAKDVGHVGHDLEDPFANLACLDAIFWATSFVSRFGP